MPGWSSSRGARGARRVVTVDVSSRAFERALREHLQDLVVKTEDEAYKITLRIRNRAVQFAPVDTGFLKGEWYARRGRDREGPFFEVGNTAEYAAEVDVGTDKMPPAPMIKPAIAEVLGITGISVRIEPKED